MIEQGADLEDHHLRLGVVTGIVGSKRYRVEFNGQQNRIYWDESHENAIIIERINANPQFESPVPPVSCLPNSP